MNRILIDGGSAVNILPLRTLKELEIQMEELSGNRLMIQGFNHEGQRTLGTIRLDLLIDDMSSTALFQVIDARTSYNMLLGCPWLHENGVIASTWHQCLKYCRDGMVKKVVEDHKPFTEAESHFAEAKYFMVKAKVVKEVQKKCDKEVKEAEKYKVKPLKGLTLPLTKIDAKKLIPPPLEGFVQPKQGAIIEHRELSDRELQNTLVPMHIIFLSKLGMVHKRIPH